MTRVALALAGAVLFSTLMTSVAAAGEFKAGVWRGKATYDEVSGRLLTCAMVAAADDRTSVLFAISADDTFSIAIRQRGLDAVPGERVPVSVEFDGAWFANVALLARRNDMVVLDLPYTEHLLRKFLDARELIIRARSWTVSYPLTDANIAFLRLRECFENEGVVRASPGSSPDRQRGAAADTLLQGEFELGGWLGAPQFDDRTEEFTGCTMATAHGKQRLLTFSISADGRFVATMTGGSSKLDAGRTEPAIVEVDGRAIGRTTVMAQRAGAASFSLDYSEALIFALRKGYELRVRGDSATWSYPLRGTNIALPRLQDCVFEQFFAADRSVRPRSDRPASPPPSRSRQVAYAAPADYAVIVEQMLNGAGLTGFRAVPGGALDPFFENAIFGWTDGKVAGAVFRIPLGEIEPEQMLSILIARYKRDCGAGSRAGVRSAINLPDGSKAQHSSVVCPDAVEDTLLSFFVFNVDDSSVTILQTAARRHEAMLHRVDDAVYRYLAGSL